MAFQVRDTEFISESQFNSLQPECDELIAMWGAPGEQPDHADRGIAAAQAMLGAIDELRRVLKECREDPQVLATLAGRSFRDVTLFSATRKLMTFLDGARCSTLCAAAVPVRRRD